MAVPENSTLLNVCIVPSSLVSHQCMELSKSLQSEGTVLLLDGKKKFAHLTLYMVRVENINIEEFAAKVDQVLFYEWGGQIFCKHTGYQKTPSRYLEASYLKSDLLLRLQELLIHGSKEFRLNPGNPFKESYFVPYDANQRKNAEETGYYAVGDLFRPHISLTRYVEGGELDFFPALPATQLSFVAQKICIYKADENGAVYELLKEFTL